ncbi:MAG TPA: nuclear transport factor 2 family protein [Bacteroidota bacterium]|nr:nuclear transport factor 2 family protein [Bacteroidota bacterium]
MSSRETALAFVDAINKHSVGAIGDLITDDHVLVDSLGALVEGRDAIRNAWIEYFYLVPDFTIHCDHVFEGADMVALFGTADGTCRIGARIDPQNHWSMPASWLAGVHGGRVVRWQVFADNEPVRKILGA